MSSSSIRITCRFCGYRYAEAISGNGYTERCQICGLSHTDEPTKEDVNRIQELTSHVNNIGNIISYDVIKAVNELTNYNRDYSSTQNLVKTIGIKETISKFNRFCIITKFKDKL
jgi:hypothetical protein